VESLDGRGATLCKCIEKRAILEPLEGVAVAALGVSALSFAQKLTLPVICDNQIEPGQQAATAGIASDTDPPIKEQKVWRLASIT